MAKRRRSSGAEDLMDVVALLPWWVGVGLAFVGYWVLHAIATRPLPVTQPGSSFGGPLVAAALWQGLAAAGQYLLPFVCLMGALASALRRRKRRKLFDTTSGRASADALQDMSWQEFELLVGEGFRRRGYAVTEIGGGGADGGVDLVLTKAGEKCFVQCKQWKAYKVGVSTVRELYGVMAAHGAASGCVVTSGRFTGEASAFASGRNIELIDGAALMALLRQARRSAQPASTRMAAPQPAASFSAPDAGTGPIPARAPSEPAQPPCPRCGKPMVRRVAKRGAHTGRVFWGCSAYSLGCRGIREVQEQ